MVHHRKYWFNESPRWLSYYHWSILSDHSQNQIFSHRIYNLKTRQGALRSSGKAPPGDRDLQRPVWKSFFLATDSKSVLRVMHTSILSYLLIQLLCLSFLPIRFVVSSLLPSFSLSFKLSSLDLSGFRFLLFFSLLGFMYSLRSIDSAGMSDCDNTSRCTICACLVLVHPTQAAIVSFFPTQGPLINPPSPMMIYLDSQVFAIYYDHCISILTFFPLTCSIPLALLTW